MSKYRCIKVRTAVGAYTADDNHAMPCRGYQVHFRNVDEQKGPEWGIADIAISVLHTCPFTEGQVYEVDFGA